MSQLLPGQNKANDRFVGQVSRFAGPGFEAGAIECEIPVPVT